MTNSILAEFQKDDVDESWAIKLLNECAQEDDEPIVIQNPSSENHPQQNDIKGINFIEDATSFVTKQSSGEYRITIDRAAVKVKDNSASSAIERQIINFATRPKLQKANSLDDSASTKSNNWIRSFF